MHYNTKKKSRIITKQDLLNGLLVSLDPVVIYLRKQTHYKKK